MNRQDMMELEKWDISTDVLIPEDMLSKSQKTYIKKALVIRVESYPGIRIQNCNNRDYWEPLTGDAGDELWKAYQKKQSQPE
jgi:hypothetical protein